MPESFVPAEQGNKLGSSRMVYACLLYTSFKNCSGLKELDLSNFDTSKVGYMMSMFDGCSGLKELDVSNFDTSKVTRMESMFSGCSGLKELDVSNFDTSKVTNMDSMFTDCSKLQLLNCSVNQFFKKGSKVFDTHISGNLPTAIKMCIRDRYKRDIT